MALFEPVSRAEVAKVKATLGKPKTKTIPEGEYLCRVKDAKTNTKDDGRVNLAVEFEVLGPVHKGFRWMQWYSLKGQSDKAIHISRVNLTELAEAMGKESFAAASEMRGIPFCVELQEKEATDDRWGPSMQIKRAWVSKNAVPTSVEEDTGFKEPWEQE